MKTSDFIRFLGVTASSLNSDGDVSHTEKLHKAATLHGANSNIVAIVKDEFSYLAKGAIPSGDSGSGWGSNLSPLPAASATHYDAIIESSLLGQLPIPRLPARLPLILSEEEADAHWVAAGDPIPATNLSFDKQPGLPLYQQGTIVTATKETFTSGDPGALAAVQRALDGAFRRKLNAGMLDPTSAGTPGLQPPSLTYGVDPISPTSGDFKETLEGMVAAFQGDLTQSYVIGKPELFIQLSGLEFPALGARGGEICGLPAIACSSLPDDSNGDYQLVLVDPSGIGWAGDPMIIIEASRSAALELRDDPVSNIANDPTPSAKISLWQLGLVAIRALMFVNWVVVRPGSVSLMNGIQKSAVAS